MNIHTGIAVAVEGLVLGVLSQSSYNRKQPGNEERPLEEKESYRWIRTLNESTADLPRGVKAVTARGREGDMYEFFDAAEQCGQRFPARAAQNRMTVDNKRMGKTMRGNGENDDSPGFPKESSRA